jgi:hypothetical protein
MSESNAKIKRDVPAVIIKQTRILNIVFLNIYENVLDIPFVSAK